MTHRSASLRQSYLAGCVLVVLAGLVLSLGVLCLRGAHSSDAWQYLFWRALAFAAVMVAVATVRHRVNPIAQIRNLSWFGWLSVVTMVASQVCFICAMKLGGTAEVFFLMSLAPLMAAMLALPLLGERIGLLGMLAVAIALGGVAMMSGLTATTTDGAVRLADGGWPGRLLALGTALSFALYSLATRGTRQEDLDAALLAVGLLTAAVGLGVTVALGLPIAPTVRDASLAILHGGVILAIGLVLYARGSRVVPGVTLVMLAQAETIAAPIWTYLVFDETTTLAVIAGGALILGAVVLQALDGASDRGTGRRCKAGQ